MEEGWREVEEGEEVEGGGGGVEVGGGVVGLEEGVERVTRETHTELPLFRQI